MKPIKDFDNYEIDTEGNVYNIITKKVLKGSIGENGYKYYRLSKNGQKKMFYAHRLVAETYLSNPDNLPVVNHLDGNKLNNNVNNLEWTTYSENTKHWKLTAPIHSTLEYYTEDLPGEVWKPYKQYLVSSEGRVRNTKRNNLLKPVITCGYYKVRLSENNLVQDWLIHRLVYAIFNDDFDFSNYVIDHIDGNKLNNNINNLRKISNSENVLSALYTIKTNSSAKAVEQYDSNGNLIATFASVREAAKHLNLDSSTISKVCRGVNKTHGGFIFKYID